MEETFVITVARGFGSGGKEIASKVAKRLGIACYENRILTLASEVTGINEMQFIDSNEKMPTPSKLSGILKKIPRSTAYITHNEKFISNDKVFQAQKDIILKLADTENCVIVGKCADHLLKYKHNVISLYIEAPREYCVKRTMDNMHVTREQAVNTIVSTDKFRAEYYTYYTGGNIWTNPINYDFTINSEKVGIDQSVEVILAYVNYRFGHLINKEEK